MIRRMHHLPYTPAPYLGMYPTNKETATSLYLITLGARHSLQSQSQISSTGLRPKPLVLSRLAHKVFLPAAGPPHGPSKPAVIIQPGHGSTNRSWAAVIRLIRAFTGVYSYERSGIGRSELSPVPRTAESIASALRDLLIATSIKPPYVFIEHG